MFTRSKSYVEQGYKPVSLSEEDSESKENSDKSTRRRFTRSVSCDNKDSQSTRKLERSASYENSAHSAETIMAEEGGQPSPDNLNDAQYSTRDAAEESSKMLMEPMGVTHPNTSQEEKRCACVTKKRVAVVFFILSLICHGVSLIHLLQDSSKDNDKPRIIGDPTKSADRKGSRTAGYTDCRLRINYTSYLKGRFEPNLSCTPVDTPNRGHMVNCDSGYKYFVPLECLCSGYSKHVNPCGNITRLAQFHCNLCNASFLCKNDGTVSEKCKESEGLLGDDCECKKCDCTGTGYTGNHCQLPEELVCITCNDEKCRNLTNCANSTHYPCQTQYEGLTWNCSKQEIKTKTQMPKCKADMQQKSDKTQTPAKYSVSNSSVSQSHMKRTQTPVIVFSLETGILICLFVIIIIITCRNKGINLHQCCARGFVIGVVGGVVIFIPAVYNCVRCCATVTVDAYKLIPYVKGLFILLSFVFLWRHNTEKLS